MVEQYTITTTPKYNFPQTPQLLPERFTELSLNSLRQVNNHFQTEAAYYVPQSEFTSKLQINPKPLELSPKHQETTVAAVDTSTIKIGETATGVIVAVRGATVQLRNGSYRYTRLGPFVFHITEENRGSVFSNLERACFGLGVEGRQTAPQLMQMPLRLASLLERWLQSNLVRLVNGGLVLFDGSLTSGIDTPASRLRETLSSARRNGNIVLAFSKATSLRVNGHLITEALPPSKAPFLLETSGLQLKPPTVLLGEVYVARLQKAGLAFRLDIDKEIPLQNRVEASERLLGADALQQGYPETLRLAHILCTFTANEVLAMQHFISRRHGIQILSRPDMHRLLFGPFGREGYA